MFFCVRDRGTACCSFKSGRDTHGCVRRAGNTGMRAGMLALVSAMAPVRGQTDSWTDHHPQWNPLPHCVGLGIPSPHSAQHTGGFRVIPAWRLVCCLCAVMTGSHYWWAWRRRRAKRGIHWVARLSIGIWIFVARRIRPNTLRAVASDRKTSSTVVAMDPVEMTSADVFEFLAEKREVSAVRRHRRLRGSTR
jgi:hypothetical protein